MGAEVEVVSLFDFVRYAYAEAIPEEKWGQRVPEGALQALLSGWCKQPGREEFPPSMVIPRVKQSVSFNESVWHRMMGK